MVRYSSSSIEGVGWRNYPNCKTSKTTMVIMLIEDPKLINVFSMAVGFIITVTTGALVFIYFAIWDCHTFRHFSYNMNCKRVLLLLYWAFNTELFYYFTIDWYIINSL